ncbi:MAG: hypothetical protein MRY81_24430 [Donghicola eburneus]|nr:hypothetical protein [Donghicola eburneus]MCI5042800.1 hypothetical protein [Donghicola eburneus]
MRDIAREQLALSFVRDAEIVEFLLKRLPIGQLSLGQIIALRPVALQTAIGFRFVLLADFTGTSGHDIKDALQTFAETLAPCAGFGLPAGFLFPGQFVPFLSLLGNQAGLFVRKGFPVANLLVLHLFDEALELGRHARPNSGFDRRDRFKLIRFAKFGIHFFGANAEVVSREMV